VDRSPPPAVTLRLARREDAPAIAAVHVDAWRATYRGIFPDDVLDGLSLGEFTQRHAARLTNPAPADARVWVAQAARGIVGFSIGGSARDPDLPPATGEVYAIYLAPDALGRGLGRALFASSLATLGEQGKREVVVWVAEANARARRFYEAAGLAPDTTAAPKSVVWKGRDLGVAEVRLRGAVQRGGPSTQRPASGS
jgi:ribosomal protein S18 acetylase RimI-like enzyme